MAKRMLRTDFDRLSEAQKTAHIKGGGWVVDSLETRKQASAPRRRGLTLPRSTFEKMSQGERDAVIAEGAIVED